MVFMSDREKCFICNESFLFTEGYSLNTYRCNICEMDIEVYKETDKIASLYKKPFSFTFDTTSNKFFYSSSKTSLIHLECNIGELTKYFIENCDDLLLFGF